MEYLQYRVYDFIKSRVTGVLNLIITGIPSILELLIKVSTNMLCFKPYYNWNTFNTSFKHDIK